MSSHPYQYVVLRLVPRVERQEFLNVGVVVRSQSTDFLEGAFHLDEDRVRALAPDLGLDDVRAALETVCRIARGLGVPEGVADGQGRRFGWIAAPRSTIVQPGPVHGGVAYDPAGTLARLVNTLVRVRP